MKTSVQSLLNVGHDFNLHLDNETGWRQIDKWNGRLALIKELSSEKNLANSGLSRRSRLSFRNPVIGSAVSGYLSIKGGVAAGEPRAVS